MKEYNERKKLHIQYIMPTIVASTDNTYPFAHLCLCTDPLSTSLWFGFLCFATNAVLMWNVDVKHLHKNQLQYYAQKRNLILPVYSCEREGPPHATRFKCSVTIDGQTYQGQEFLPTLKDAEHAAAEIALISLMPNGVQEVIVLTTIG